MRLYYVVVTFSAKVSYRTPKYVPFRSKVSCRNTKVAPVLLLLSPPHQALDSNQK